jgi:hypothetical protein
MITSANSLRKFFGSQLGDFLNDSQLLHTHLTEEQIGSMNQMLGNFDTMVD